MVASRWPQRLDLRAAATSTSTSDAVRYSRVLATVEFTIVGAVSSATRESMKNRPPFDATLELSIIFFSAVASDGICVSQSVAAPCVADFTERCRLSIRTFVMTITE
jgi:hypothetical protein